MSETSAAVGARVAMLLLGLAALIHMDRAGFRLTDPDFFVNLYTGREIVERRAIPGVDTVTFTVDGEPWEDYEWLSRVVFYGCYRLGGGAGLVVFRLTLLAVVVTLLFAQSVRRRAGPLVFAVVLALLALYLPRYLAFRTRLFTFAGLAALLLLISEARRGRPRLLWLAPPLIAVWANLHGGFVLGMGLLGMVAAESTLAWGIGPRPGRLAGWIREAPRVRPAQAWAVLAVSFVASGAHPFGYANWVAIGETMHGAISPWISEWRPLHDTPPGLQVKVYALMVLAAGALLVGRRRIGPFEVLALLSLCLATVTRVRFVPLLTIAVALLLPGELAGSRRRRSRGAVLPATAAGLLLAALLFDAQRDVAIWKTPRFTPVRAVEFMKANGIEGRILNELDWGGYLAFSLPRSRIFVDPRSDTVYPPDLLGEWYRFVAAEGWRAIAERRKVDLVLLRQWHTVVPELRADPRWVEIFRTRQADEADPGARETLFVLDCPRHAGLLEAFRERRLLSPAVGTGSWRVGKKALNDSATEPVVLQ